MTDTETQIRNVFRELGLEPNELNYNDNTGKYKVNVREPGTSDDYMESTGEIGAGEPVDCVLDYSKVKEMRHVIDGTEINAGTITVDGMNGDYFLISIE